MMKPLRLCLLLVITMFAALLPGVAAAHPSAGPDGPDDVRSEELFEGEGVISDKQHDGEDGHLPAKKENVELISKLEVSDPTDPDGEGIEGRVADVAAWGDYAYLTAFRNPVCEGGGFYVIDISEPTAPVEVAFEPATAGNYAGEGAHVIDVATPDFTGQILIHNNEICDYSVEPNASGGGAGISLWDVTIPEDPQPLAQNFGDETTWDPDPDDPDDPGRFTHEYHSAFAWEQGGRVFVVGTDNDEGEDIDIFDITDPRAPVLVAETGLADFPQAMQDPPPNGNSPGLHDMVVEQINGNWFMLASYWDAGYLIFDMKDPENPEFLRATDYADTEPFAEELGLPEGFRPEGNAHQAEFSPDGSLFIGTDEDFNPYRSVGEVGGTVRLSGINRLETAVDISQDTYGDDEAETVVLARADLYPDALAGAPLAVQANGPLLLTSSNKLEPVTAAEIQRVLPAGGTVHLLGGVAALEPVVEQAVKDLGFKTVRIGGTTRIETSVAVARALGDTDSVLITTGYDFPDALAAGAAAGHTNGAVVLTTAEEPHGAVDEYLAERGDSADRYAIGGPAARAYPDAQDVFGKTRTETAVEVAHEFFDTPNVVGVARHDKFPDALSGGAHIGRLGGPVLLTPTTALHNAPADYICEQPVRTAFVYGGTAAIAESTLDTVDDRVRGEGCDGGVSGVLGFTATQGSDVPQITDETPLEGRPVYVGLGCNDPADDPEGANTIAPAEGEGQIALIARGACFFTDKLENAQEAGYEAAIIFNAAIPGCEGLINMLIEGDIPALFVGRDAGLAMAGVSTDDPCETDNPDEGAWGVPMVIDPVFDGWGYVHLFNSETMEDLDQYAIPEALDPAFAEGFGDLTVHEVAVDPLLDGIAYLSYYAGGYRVIEYDAATGINEIGAFIDDGGNNFWGVEHHTLADGTTNVVLASDRDYGLYIFAPGVVPAP